MRIALLMATLRGAGSSQVGQALLEALPLVRPRHHYEAWVPDAWPTQGPAGGGAVVVHRVPSGLAHKLRTEACSVRRAIRHGRVDAVLALGDTTFPNRGTPTVLFVQQAFLAYEKADWGTTLPAALRLKLALMAAYFRIGKDAVTRFAVQTEDMKDRLCRRWGLPRELVGVIPTALAPAWDALASGGERTRASAQDLLCCPTTGAAYKNLHVLAPMLQVLKATMPGVRLALTVTPASVPGFVAAARRHGVLGHVLFLGPLGRDALMALVARSAVVVLPSLLESFGLSYYEAAAAGTPVVAADLAFAREALGGAGLYAPPHDGSAWAERVRELLDSGERWASVSRALRHQYLSKRRTPLDVAEGFASLVEAAA